MIVTVGRIAGIPPISWPVWSGYFQGSLKAMENRFKQWLLRCTESLTAAEAHNGWVVKSYSLSARTIGKSKVNWKLLELMRQLSRASKQLKEWLVPQEALVQRPRLLVRVQLLIKWLIRPLYPIWTKLIHQSSHLTPKICCWNSIMMHAIGYFNIHGEQKKGYYSIIEAHSREKWRHLIQVFSPLQHKASDFISGTEDRDVFVNYTHFLLEYFVSISIAAACRTSGSVSGDGQCEWKTEEMTESRLTSWSCTSSSTAFSGCISKFGTSTHMAHEVIGVCLVEAVQAIFSTVQNFPRLLYSARNTIIVNLWL